MITDMITEFQQKVYDFVKTIPKGKTATYKEVAVAIGRPKAYRAVGNVLNKNPFAPIVPCHRVIKSNGDIGWRHWGICVRALKKGKITTWRITEFYFSGVVAEDMFFLLCPLPMP